MLGNWTTKSLFKASKSRGSMVSPGLSSILRTEVREVRFSSGAPGKIFQNVAAKWLRESLVWLSNLSLGAE